MPANPTPSANQASAVLATAKSQGIVATATAPSQTQMGSWIPPRQIWAGGLAAIVAWIILHMLVGVGVDLDAIAVPLGFPTGTVFTYLSGAIGAAIAWIVPPAQRDIIQHLNDAIVHVAQRDPQSNVSYVIAPVQPPPGEAATIVPPAKKDA